MEIISRSGTRIALLVVTVVSVIGFGLLHRLSGDMAQTQRARRQRSSRRDQHLLALVGADRQYFDWAFDAVQGRSRSSRWSAISRCSEPRSSRGWVTIVLAVAQPRRSDRSRSATSGCSRRSIAASSTRPRSAWRCSAARFPISGLLCDLHVRRPAALALPIEQPELENFVPPAITLSCRGRGGRPADHARS